MTPRNSTKAAPVRSIIDADGEVLEAPYDPSCGACRSPWIMEIDRGLAAGLSYTAIRKAIGNRRPAAPNEEILHRHVDHLPEAQRDLRRQLEDPGRSLIGAAEAADAIVQLGYKLLLEGRIDLTGSDWIRAMKLQADLERGKAAFASAEQWKQAFMAFFELARKHMPADRWIPFQQECRTSPEISAVSPSAQSAVPLELTG